MSKKKAFQSEFDVWFEAQYGPRVYSGWKKETDRDLEDVQARGLSAKVEEIRRRRWDAQNASARKAWEAKS